MRVVAVIGATENLPSGHSMKPGDILRARNGTTIEVINTDAEGRLVLADCLHHAVEQGAERLVDLATLTGAIVTTLGTTYAGLMGDRRRLVRGGRRRRAGAPARSSGGCRCTPEYAELIKGRYGDIVNAVENRARRARSPRPSSSSASSATSRGRTSTSPASPGTPARPTRPRAATGYGVRLLVELASAHTS